MARTTLDRRVQRTRRLLQEALVQLILDKGYDKITVQDILDRANVGRATFYAHFRDKEDLFLSGMQDLLESLREQLRAASQIEGSQVAGLFGPSLVLFEHVHSHLQVYKALAGKQGGHILIQYAHSYLAKVLHEHLEHVVRSRQNPPVVPLELTVQYVTSALVSLVTWWLDHNLPYTAEEMHRLYEQLTRPVLATALNIDL